MSGMGVGAWGDSRAWYGSSEAREALLPRWGSRCRLGVRSLERAGLNIRRDRSWGRTSGWGQVVC